jgi:hypothetical protein
MSIKITLISDAETESMANDLAFRYGVPNENKSVQYRLIIRKAHNAEFSGNKAGNQEDK